MEIKQSKKLLEEMLIEQVKNDQQGALIQLYALYRPLINSIKQQYYIRYYDEQDWEQEALIVCYQSAIMYQKDKGKFGSYYKVRLLNHIRSILRYHMAYRRKASSQAISIEKAITQGLRPIYRPTVMTSEVPLTESLKEAVQRLSKLEIWTLLVILGVYQQEEVIKYLKVNQVTMIRARSRLIKKMRTSLQR